MQVGGVGNRPIAASMQIGGAALQQKKNDNDLAKVIPDNLKTDAENVIADSKKLTKDMRAKLKEIKEDMRMDISPEDMKDARRLLRLMRGLTNNHINTSKRYANELEPITTEKMKLDKILDGKGKADFEDMTNEEALIAVNGRSYEAMARGDLTAHEQAAAYKLFGNAYLEKRSEVLTQKIDDIRGRVSEHNQSVQKELGLLSEEWRNKFGGNPKLAKLMKKMMMGDDGFADTNADDLLQSLKDAIYYAEQQLKNMDRLVDGFEKDYSKRKEEKVYA